MRVRAHVAENSTALDELLVDPAVRLVGRRGGVELAGSPLDPVATGTLPRVSAVDRRQSRGSFMFRLPDDWTSGTISLEATVNPVQAFPEVDITNNKSTATVTFREVLPYCLNVVSIVTTSGVLPAPGMTWTSMVDRAVSVLPLTGFDIGFNSAAPMRRPRLPFAFLQGTDPWVLDTDIEMAFLIYNLFWDDVFNVGFACWAPARRWWRRPQRPGGWGWPARR